MNIITNFSLENFKATKDKKTYKTENFIANKPAFLVAPNGYGKSTLAQAIQSLTNSKLHNKDFPNAKLEITLQTDAGKEVLSADAHTNNISKKISTFVINNGLYAKNTGQNMGRYQTKSASLKIKDITIVEKIPEKQELDYKITQLKQELSCAVSIKSDLDNLNNLRIIVENISPLRIASSQKRIQKLLEKFISSEKEDIDLQRLRANTHINKIFQFIENDSFVKGNTNIPSWQHVIQLIKLCPKKDFKGIFQYSFYKDFKKQVQKTLQDFNTTGRDISTQENKGKLILVFPPANSISNGERDILYFLASLFAFQYTLLQKNMALLIIDEIFDYLDGGNLVTVQYYLSQLIKRTKENHKVLFCCIFTHLDPNLFNTCYFKKPKFIYLENCDIKEPDPRIIKLLQLRNKDKRLHDTISTFFLHYTNVPINKDDEIEIKEKTDIASCKEFHEKNLSELKKYISGQQFDPLSVVCAVRYFAEKQIFEKLSAEKQKIFLDTHKTLEKFHEVSNEIDIDERLYFLSPLYNDPMHIIESNKEITINITKIKLTNKVIHKIITELFGSE